MMNFHFRKEQRRLKDSGTIFTILGAMSVLATLVLAVITPVRADDAATPLVLSASAPKNRLGPYLEILEDVGGALTVDQVSSPDFVDDFVRSEKGIPDLGFSSSAFWLRFSLVDRDVAVGKIESRQWLLTLNRPYYSLVQLYIPADDTKAGSERDWVVEEAGDPDRLSRGHVPRRPLFFSITLNSAEPIVFYMRIESDSRLTMPLTMWSPQGFHDHERRIMLWQGLYFGLILFMVFYNFSLYWNVRDRTYVWYIVYVLGMALYYIFSQGLCYEIWGLYPGSVSRRLSMIVIVFFVISIVPYTRSFLNTAQNTPRLDLLLRLLLIPAVLFPAPALFIELRHLERLAPNLAFVVSFAALLTGFVNWRKGLKAGRFFTAAWGVFFMGGMFHDLTFYGFLPFSTLGAHALQIGSGLEILLLSLALIDRMKILRSERERLALARDKAEKEVKASEFRFRAIFDQTFQFMAVASPDGRIIEINRPWLRHSELTEREVLGRPIWETLWWKRNDERSAGIEKATASAAQGELVRFEITLEETDPQPLYLDLSFKPVMDDTGRVALIIVEARDITQTRRLERAMFRAEKMAALGRVMAGIAHEIQNPNNFIHFNIPILRDYIQDIRRQFDCPVEDPTDIRIVNMPYEAAMDDLSGLVDDMEHGSMRISKIVSEMKYYIHGRSVESMKWERIDRVIETAVVLAGRQILKMVDRFDVEAAENMSPVWMNSGKIEQVLINLLVNAGQAANEEGSWVRLTAGEADGPGKKVIVTVEDNGVGIPDDLAERVFEPFFTTKEPGVGAGLGLALCRRIVREHGGRLYFESQPGRRTCFTMELPVDGKDENHDFHSDR